MVARRIAVIGGDHRQQGRWGTGPDVRYYASPTLCGNGELRRLKAAIRAGSFDEVLLLSRLNGHATTRSVAALCKRCNVRCRLVS